MNTLISPNSSLSFPSRNEAVRANWMPLYLEPMIGSGERICIGVATANSSGFLVVPVTALSRLECVYGKGVEAILIAANFAITSLRALLSKDGVSALHKWAPPMEGIYCGQIANGAGANLEEICRTGLTACASLVERIAEADELPTSERVNGNRLEQLIKDRVLAARPGLEQMFGRQRKLGEHIRPTTIGFVGNVIAANFGILAPHQLSTNVKDIKSKLWDLAQLREDFGTPSLITSTVTRFEMLIHRPANDAPEYSARQMENINEAANELEAEADKKDIRCRPLTGHEAIANVLLEAEAA